MYGKHTFLILHAHAAIWKERGTLSARSSPVKHKELILRLLEAGKLPAKVAVLHCQGHQRGKKRRPREVGKLTRRQDELPGKLPLPLLSAPLSPRKP